jgi:hypothetical protein
MSRITLAALTVAAAALAATGAPGIASRTRAVCGVELWSLKTLSDPQRRLVRLSPRTTTVRAINARPMPSSPPRRRDRFERQVWHVKAQIVEYRLEDDGDIHMVLFDRGAYMIAEMPTAACLPPTTRDRRAIVLARRRFENACGTTDFSWHQLGAVAYISGVGFWDFPHGQTGAARNYAEVHPVTAVRIISGCGG